MQLLNMSKVHKNHFIVEHYSMFKEFIWNIISHAAFEIDYTIFDSRVLDWAEWLSQRGHYSLD